MEAHPGKLHRLFDKNFLEYTSYVIRERAIPAVEDGLKPVQRRILQTLFNMEDGRFHKVANVVGETMKLHPHGDQSIFAALVNLANKGFLLEQQGNFGNIYTGDRASAARYIECRLSPLAKEVLFNKDLTTFVDSYDGRMQEPVTLPAKIPLLMMMGAEGIAVGMATKILPHNFCELLEAQKSILRGEPFVIYPDFQQGGLIDVGNYEDGNGKIRCRARIEEQNEKTIVIREIPYATTTQSLTDSIEKAAKAGKIKIVSINDYTAENVEIEIKLARGIYARDTIEALYAFTDCEMSIVPNLTLINGATPETSTVSEVLHLNTSRLKSDLEKELQIEQGRLEEKLHGKILEQIFIEERLYKNIEEETSYQSILTTVLKSFAPYHEQLMRPISKEDVERLLEIRIKRISRYDINKQAKEIKEIRKRIKEIIKSLQDMVGFTIAFLDDLLSRYGHLYPRRSELTEFSEVSVRSVALSNLLTVYNRQSGFLGHQIKEEHPGEDLAIPCSEYDRLFMLFTDGAYKVIPVTEKLYVGSELLWFGVVQKEMVFNIIYRDGAENLAYIKRFQMPSFILDKEYRLFPEHKRSRILHFDFGDNKRVKVSLVPSLRAKTNTVEISFDDYLIKNVAAKGKRVANRAIRRIVPKEDKGDSPQQQNLPLPGLLPKPAKDDDGEKELKESKESGED